MTGLLDACLVAAIITAEIVASALYLIRQISKSTFAAAWALASSLTLIRALANHRPWWAALAAAVALLMASVWWDEQHKPRTDRSST